MSRFPTSWRFLSSFALILLGSARGQDSTITPDEVAQGFRNGRVLVKLKADQITGDSVRQDTEGKLGVTRRRSFEHLDRQQVLEFDLGRNVRATVKTLEATGLYEFVEPDRVLHALAVPNDPTFSQQWSLRNTGQMGTVAGVAGADISAVSAWDTQSSASGIVVAILDSGMRLTHSDLSANLWTNPSPSSVYGSKVDLHGINATASPITGDPTDDNGHGTHVSGITAASGNNGTGISGVAWSAQLMALKFLDSSGSGSQSAELTCLDYAIAHHAVLINGSFGSNSYSASEFAAIQKVHDAGIIFVVAAGNDGLSVESDAAYPAGYLLDNIVTVAATTRTDAIASYSNFSSGSVDLGAPGDEITSTYNTSDTGYTILSGTSMAAPHVTGALALLKAHFPTDTYRQSINRLLRSTTRLNSLSGKVQTGGRLNLAAALTSTDTRPFNDDFAARAQLSGSNIILRSSNVGAKGEIGEPAHAGVSGGTSLWWTWTAPSSGPVLADTVGSSYDTLLAIYTGTSLSSLTAVASNDNLSTASTASKVVFTATAGTTYQIAIDGKNGASGLTVLHLGVVPPNDNFASAQLVSGISLGMTGSTANASAEAGEPNHANTSAGRSVWYQWVAPISGQFQVSAVSASADTVAAVYTGSAVGSLTTIASNNDANVYTTDALATFTATAGQRYYIAIDSSTTTTNGGDFTLNINDSLWQWSTGGEITSSPAVASDGTVIAGSKDYYIYALNPNGTEKWEANLAAAIDLSSPAIGADGTVYIGSGDKNLYALNGSTGKKRWTFAAGTAIASTPAIAADGSVYFHDDNTLYALNAGTSSATQKWALSLSLANYCSPAIATDGTIYIGTVGGNFYAINPDGTTKWKYAANSDVYTSPAVDSDGSIYFASLSGTVYALKPDGSLKWTWTTSGITGITASIAIGLDGSLYVAAYDGKLHALTKSGTEKWSYKAGDQVRASSPVVASDGTVYFGTYDHSIYAVSSAGALQRIFATADIIRSSPVIAAGRLYFGSNDFKVFAFNIAQNLGATPWPGFHQNALHTGRATASSALTLTASPQSQIAAVGSSVTFTAAATGTAPVTYQWYFNGTAIAGATSSSYTLSSVTAANAGAYRVIVTDLSGSISSSTATLAIGTASATDARLYALATRAPVGTGDSILIPGIVVGGTNTRQVIVRASGPALAAQGVTGVLAAPQLQLFQVGVSAPVATNTGWSTGSAAQTAMLQAAFTQDGLTAFPVGSADCAVIATLNAGSAYTAQVSGMGNSTGVALVEVYEYGTGNARMTALACRAVVGTGGNILIPGLVISGTTPKKLIVRASGPALTKQGVNGALALPHLEIFNGSASIAQNSGWSSGTSDIPAATASVGLQPFDANSADCAIVITLNPGAYTAQVSGLNNTSGVSLVEVYELP